MAPKEDVTPFMFIGYDFDEISLRARFYYRGGTAKNPLDFVEIVDFCDRAPNSGKINYSPEFRQMLDRALFFAFITIGTSYYKCFPTASVRLAEPLSGWRANFFDAIYQDGLSQFAYENHLERKDLAHFVGLLEAHDTAPTDTKKLFDQANIPLVLQSGGKDSLLTATILNEEGREWSALYISSTNQYPEVLNELSAKNIQTIKRQLDHENLKKAAVLGGKNGHVPVTYINIALALVQAILNGQTEIITSIGHEGAEAHTVIKSSNFEEDLAVNHQWSKTDHAERYLQKYLSGYISEAINVHSLIRKYSELKIAKMFVEKCWSKFGHKFSSCNRANYKQGENNQTLTWCGECAKCANSYLLFAPFLEEAELNSIFKDQVSLFEKPELIHDFKGLLGIDGTIKPFECVGEVDELRKAYHMKKPGYKDLPFAVPDSNFDLEKTY